MATSPNKKPTPRRNPKPPTTAKAPAKPKAKPISLDAIVVDGRTQSRQRTDPEVVDQYAEAWRDGMDFPPVDLFTEDGDLYYVADGIHRCLGAIKAERSSIPAIVHEGDEHAARVFACSANKNHGLHRSNADKRNAVALMLELEPSWSNRKIAEHVGVGNQLVGDVRKSLESTARITQLNERVGSDGKIRKVPPKASTGKVQEKMPEPLQQADDTETAAPDEAPGFDLEAAAEIYHRAVNDLNRIKRDLVRATETTNPYLADSITRASEYIDSIKALIRMNTPTEVCEGCEGDGCDGCRDSGFIPHQVVQRRRKAI